MYMTEFDKRTSLFQSLIVPARVQPLLEVPRKPQQLCFVSFPKFRSKFEQKMTTCRDISSTCYFVELQTFVVGRLEDGSYLSRG